MVPVCSVADEIYVGQEVFGGPQSRRERAEAQDAVGRIAGQHVHLAAGATAAVPNGGKLRQRPLRR